MAATVYGLPEGFDSPEFGDFMGEDHRYDTDGYLAACDEHRQRLAEWCRAQQARPNDLIGKTISFPAADGRAEYMVYTTKPLAFIHLDYMDGYTVPNEDIVMRGMRVADVRRMVQQDEKIAEIFGGR